MNIFHQPSFGMIRIAKMDARQTDMDPNLAKRVLLEIPGVTQANAWIDSESDNRDILVLTNSPDEEETAKILGRQDSFMLMNVTTETDKQPPIIHRMPRIPKDLL